MVPRLQDGRLIRTEWPLRILPGSPDANDQPWWLVVLVLIALALAGVIIANDLYTQVFTTVIKGLGVTVFVTMAGFTLATALGLMIALMGLSRHGVLRQVARFYTRSSGESRSSCSSSTSPLSGRLRLSPSSISSLPLLSRRG